MLFPWPARRLIRFTVLFIHDSCIERLPRFKISKQIRALQIMFKYSRDRVYLIDIFIYQHVKEKYDSHSLKFNSVLLDLLVIHENPQSPRRRRLWVENCNLEKNNGSHVKFLFDGFDPAVVSHHPRRLPASSPSLPPLQNKQDTKNQSHHSEEWTLLRILTYRT